MRLALAPFAIIGLVFLAPTAAGQSVRAQPEYWCAFEEYMDGPVCREWYRAYRERMKALRGEEAAAESPEAAAVVPDTSPPVIEVAAPDETDLAAGAFRVSGLVGDDGGPPRLKVNGKARILTSPAPGAARLGRYTLAFRVDVPTKAVGVEQVVIEACDSSGNCAVRKLNVRVVASPPPQGRAVAVAPAPTPPAVKTEGEAQQVLQALLEKLEAGGFGSRPSDRELPLLEVEAPARVEVGEPARVAGRVGDDGSPPRLKVNGKAMPLFELRPGARPLAKHTLTFEFEIDSETAGEKFFVLEACDADGNCFARKLVVAVVASNRPSSRGRNFALIIGNNAYEHLPDLKTAVNDASALAELLLDRYAFREEDVRLLLNVDRRTILAELSELRRRLGEEDRLLLYYAGHGQIDPATEEGFWLPVDAKPGEDFNWIDNGDVRRYIKGMPARHVLVVADSCFSGSLTRAAGPGAGIASDRFFAEIDASVSRKVISSGGTEPVADSGSGRHSVFAYYLLKALRTNDKPYLTSFELFNGLVRAVANNSNQKPEFGTITGAGDEGAGDFTFILKKDSSG